MSGIIVLGGVGYCNLIRDEIDVDYERLIAACPQAEAGMCSLVPILSQADYDVLSFNVQPQETQYTDACGCGLPQSRHCLALCNRYISSHDDWSCSSRYSKIRTC